MLLLEQGDFAIDVNGGVEGGNYGGAGKGLGKQGGERDKYINGYFDKLVIPCIFGSLYITISLLYR